MDKKTNLFAVFISSLPSSILYTYFVAIPLWSLLLSSDLSTMETSRFRLLVTGVVLSTLLMMIIITGWVLFFIRVCNVSRKQSG